MNASATMEENFEHELALLDERLAEHGLNREDAQRADVHVQKNWPPYGPVAIFPYRRSDGTTVRRLLILEHPKGDKRGGWRWPHGTEARGAVLTLGDPMRAATVLILEGESDGISMWRHLHTDPDQFAVISLPGSSMVDDDLAGLIGNGARVIVGTDADAAGDGCAARVRQVLLAARHDAERILRFRPVLDGVDHPDVRDVIEALETHGASSATISEWVTDSARPFGDDAPFDTDDPPDDDDVDEPLHAPSNGVRTLSLVKEMPIRWLADGMIPFGALTLLVGAGGLGKTCFALHVAARVTRGQPIFPGMTVHEPADVLIASAEDAIEQVLTPRARIAGADLERIHAVDLGERDLTLPDDVDWLREQAERVSAKLIIIDPLSAFLGISIDSHKDASLRGALRPLHALAEATGAAFLGPAHTNKAAGGDIGLRVTGSAGWVNAARSALVFGPKPDAEDSDPTRIVAVAKSNYAARGVAHELTLRVPPGEEHPAIGYVGPSGVRPSDLLTHDRDERRSAIDDAEAFVRDLLEDGDWHASADVKTAALNEQHKRRTIERAATERLGVEIDKRDFPRATWWRLAPAGPGGGPA